MLALFLVPLLFSGAFAEQIPDYYKPYAPIYFDRDIYSWTDKVRITIAAPAWNANQYGIDSIGDDFDHPIKISTSSASLNQYKLTETSPNSGVFTGEIILSGFAHDADGDGDDDTTPRTSGSGPTGGFLETDRDDGLTISFEFADGVVLTESAQIQWNIAEAEFSNPNYLENDQVLIQVIDPDMNLNPETLDDVQIDVSSDSDSAGIKVIATETDDESGIFEATIILTQSDDSSGNRLRALDGDTITAIYKDRTLPAPNSIRDDLDIIAKSQVGSGSPGASKIAIDEIYLADSQGKQIQNPKQNQQFQIITHIQNLESHKQDFTNIIQITDQNGAVVSLSWIVGNLNAGQNFEISQSWTPKHKGQYTVEAFVWKSLDDASPLAQAQVQTVTIQ
ncbi:hypothetical protein [Candidatus Nitrosotenuis aquarius]|uniref:hypothetical protein n=1 Tax=Candidatus Nitrosotenuis aquarius TaxID=1846278 RepID=UPI000C1EC25C|nr:hypothetical protein [Candidatus Nitrosotenuis aquarius]